jgi:hypothetical protein
MKQCIAYTKTLGLLFYLLLKENKNLYINTKMIRVYVIIT